MKFEALLEEEGNSRAALYCVAAQSTYMVMWRLQGQFYGSLSGLTDATYWMYFS